MTTKTIAIIAGEESGDLLGADIVRGLKTTLGADLILVGVGGEHLQAEGLKSIIDPSEIALMGVTAIVKNLPRLIVHLHRVAANIIAAKPDALIIIDSPEFTQRVAQKVKVALPLLPVINYVCPSVWAWRPQRAKTMAGYINEVLCILPFEPSELARLGGPKGTYVGHRLTSDVNILAVQNKRKAQTSLSGQLMLLPGSRAGEIKRLLPDILETARLMIAKGLAKSVVLPTLERLRGAVETAVFAADLPCKIVYTPEEKWQAFSTADAALAASGTVSLELALCGVPHASVYRMDFLAEWILSRLLIAWSGNLPNLIADRAIVPERYGRYFRPDALSRIVGSLMEDHSLERQAQLAGFESVRRALKTEHTAAEIAAARVISYL